ncbi:BrnA antitoxin family protein [Spongiibacter sp. KMU-166]|uniref:BrnA antitoxin family protein n=1 Tax=Spongiibacter thalassae TaxID=2721624 RepID=A0ABX1GG03_9GAMM|nr:BrnA antitoxin family protein [Spongiibacter thalassae]NKI17422.1 BrnA antitoxin family protein [Spongiibacter thalassae]
MKKQPNPEKIDTENPEWDDNMFAKARPASEVLPKSLMAAAKRKPGRPLAQVKKVQTTMRFDPEILEAFKKTGAGWQTRMNDALADWLETHDPGTKV